MMRRFRPISVRVVVCVVCALAFGRARAESVFDTAARMPATADVVLVVHDGSEMRTSAIGRAAIETMDRLVGFGETGRAWERVSAALEMTPEAAFDALLGDRMAFASSIDQGGTKHWVLLSRIRPDVRDRMKRSLKPAPRDFAEGAVVLAIEDGAYTMVVLEQPGEHPFVVIGPGQSDPMVLDVVRAIRRPGAATLGATPEMALLHRLGNAHANVLALVRDSTGEGSWTGLVGVARDGVFGANFRVEMPTLAEVPENAPLWSRTAFARLSEGALAAAVDISGPMDVAGPAADLIMPLGLPDDMKAVMGSRVAMLVRPGLHGPLEAAVSVETSDTTAMARAGDQWIDRLLSSLPVERGGSQLHAAQFVAMPSTASRALDLSRQMPALRDRGWGAGPVLTWKSRIVVENCNPGQHQGWWTVGLGSGAVGALSAMTANPPTDPVALPWVAMGVVRPAALMEALSSAGWEVPEALRPASRLREVRWEAMRAGPVALMGNLRLEVDSSVARGDR